RAEVALLAFVAAYMLVVDSSYEMFWRSVLPALPALALLGRERRLLATADTCLPLLRLAVSRARYQAVAAAAQRLDRGREVQSLQLGAQPHDVVAELCLASQVALPRGAQEVSCGAGAAGLLQEDAEQGGLEAAEPHGGAPVGNRAADRVEGQAG